MFMAVSRGGIVERTMRPVALTRKDTTLNVKLTFA
jgi:hypothetical protein